MSDQPQRALVTVYRHRSKGTYRVQPHGYEDGFLVEVGEPIVVSSTEAPERIATAIHEGLKRCADSSLRPIVETAPEYAKFRREHDAVAIEYESHALELTPQQHVRGGFKGMRSEKIVLPPPVTHQDLAAMLAQAFRRTG